MPSLKSDQAELGRRAVFGKPGVCCPDEKILDQPACVWLSAALRVSTRRNAVKSARSYAILRTPQATSGAARARGGKMAPVSEGLSAAESLRGTAVKLAAAGRSAGVTT